MLADSRFLQDASNDTWVAFAGALALHVLLVLVLVVAGWWQPVPVVVSVAGPVIEASLVVTAEDVQRSEQALAEAPKPEPAPEPEPAKPMLEEAAPPPQPLPEPRPQTSEQAIQPEPQAPQAEPDTVDQERIVRLAAEKAEKEKQEQEAKRRQEQIDLTERKKQQEAERRQRLLRQQAQLDAIRRERETAARATKLAEQRLQQLADRQPAASKPTPGPTATTAAPMAGNNGTDASLEGRYVIAMQQTAHANWNRALVPERVPCRVTFIQIPGGEVIDVRFGQCPYDTQGRDSVDRALRKTPMPYAGFESVFSREVTLTFCYPEEACK